MGEKAERGRANGQGEHEGNQAEEKKSENSDKGKIERERAKRTGGKKEERWGGNRTEC